MGTKWGLIDEERQIKGIENRLQATLLPVSPRPEFVKDLKHRLLSPAEADASIVSSKPKQNVFVLAAGLLSGTVLIVLGVKAIIALLASLGLLQQVKSRMEQQKCAPPLTPAT